MVGSVHHELAKWQASLLQPVLKPFSVNYIKDSFMSSETIQQLKLDSDNVYFCSFDITGLFTNVPLTNLIKICSSSLCENSTTLTTSPIPQVFVE